MDRRTFVLLTGATSGALLRPPIQPSAGSTRAVERSGQPAVGRLRFELDDQRRWSLWYYGDGAPVPLVRGAEIVAWVGDQPLTLAELEDTTVGNRRPPGGDAVVVRGRAAGVWVEAELLAAGGATAPQASVTVTVFPDRYLPTVKGVRFFRLPPAELVAGDGPLVALVNGAHSTDGCRVVTVGAPEAADLASPAAAGLTRGSRGLAIAFDPTDPGEARLHLSRDGLEAVSDWLPSRPLRPEGDASRMRLCFHPEGDGLEALHALFVPTSPVDQERLAQAVAPAGWCTRSELSGTVDEADVIGNLEFCAANFDRRFFRHIELDDGYQRAVGAWDTNDRFPHGHAWLTDQIHARGFKAGLWVAPFGVAEGSGVPAAQPDWLLRDAGGPVLCDTRDAWGGGGKVFALDGAHPKVQQWLFDLARRVVRDWGYDYLRIDLLRWATLGTAHYGGLTHAEAYRAGLGAIRDGLGTEAFLLASGAPLQHAVGLVNGMRIGPDVDASWAGIQPPARATGLRSFYQRSTWLNDPDCLVVRPPLPRAAAEAWASLVAVTGGLTLFSDNLPKLPADRIPLLQRTLPVAPVAGRALEAGAPERETAPAVVAGDAVHPIGGPWRFRTGDDPSYASRGFDEEAWETIPVPQRWSEGGHRDYVGFGWYRTRFQLPSPRDGKTEPRNVFLELGKIADADETFVNGVKVGQTGEPSHGGRAEPQTYRRYRVPPETLNWGGENVVAVRAFGSGGIWSVRRSRPPRFWVAEGAPRWWTVVVVNWEDESRDLALPLAALGVRGAKFDAYDVWRDAVAPDVKEVLTLTLEPRTARTIAIRPAAARPQVVGTTRHIVQGAVDVADETWDPITRTLKAKATNLDRRAYAITIVVPKGMRPGACKADVACTVRTLPSGHAVIEWAAGGDGRDIKWELSFRSAGVRRKND
jgi:melibiase-like protein